MAPIYNVDFLRLVQWLVPPYLRQANTMNWLKVLVTPIITLYSNWRRYYNDVNARIAITPQVCFLEGACNDAIDPVERRIYFEDTPGYLVQLIHTDEAQNPFRLFIENYGHNAQIINIHDDSAYDGNGVDFNVLVPFVIDMAQEYRLRSILQTYKLAGKSFKIYIG
jgi:hypothetical protein